MTAWIVMPGLNLGIDPLRETVDCRVKPVNDREAEVGRSNKPME
jgi:hypothetical protein